MKFDRNHLLCCKNVIKEVFQTKNNPELLDDHNLFSRETQHGIRYTPESNKFQTYRLIYKLNPSAKKRFISSAPIVCSQFDNFADSLLDICISHSKVLIRNYLHFVPKLNYLDLEYLITGLGFLSDEFNIHELPWTNRMDVDGSNYVYCSNSYQLLRYNPQPRNMFDVGEVELIDGEENEQGELAFFSALGEEVSYNNFKDAVLELMFRIVGFYIESRFFNYKLGTHYSQLL